MNTGKHGWYNSRINAIAPFLIEEDIICYLDDDNFYQVNHIQSIVDVYQQQDTDYVYTLRNFIDKNGQFLCQDRTESIGNYRTELPEVKSYTIKYQGYTFYDLPFIIGNEDKLIDVNCYAFKKQIAQKLCHTWNTIGFGNDRKILKQLNDMNLTGTCTKQFSVNYQFLPRASALGICLFFESIFKEHQLHFDEKDIEQIAYSIITFVNNNAQIPSF